MTEAQAFLYAMAKDALKHLDDLYARRPHDTDTTLMVMRGLSNALMQVEAEDDTATAKKRMTR